MSTVTLVNPWSGATVEHDVSNISIEASLLYASRMSDVERYACEGPFNTPGEWVANMVETLGVERASAILLS